eukprot:TRINITY_DN23021_c0_g1_i1.p1 TRINITY_DN23021_c0_g1~~TRINITY_DN23021_c0_g1_i1.p1  ORF type:complete len:208 (-),score=-17.53 TRINITY_DN23021_c0_g1_i1:95-718(-)
MLNIVNILNFGFCISNFSLGKCAFCSTYIQILPWQTFIYLVQPDAMHLFLQLSDTLLLIFYQLCKINVAVILYYQLAAQQFYSGYQYFCVNQLIIQQDIFKFVSLRPPPLTFIVPFSSCLMQITTQIIQLIIKFQEIFWDTVTTIKCCLKNFDQGIFFADIKCSTNIYCLQTINFFNFQWHNEYFFNYNYEKKKVLTCIIYYKYQLK